MRRALILTLAFLFLLPCVSFAGWFTDEPPDEWGKLPLLYLIKGEKCCGCLWYRDPNSKTKMTRKDCYTFGLFQSTIEDSLKGSKDIEKISWREGKKSGKWMLHIASFKEETNRRTETIIVFTPYKTPKGFRVVLAESLYVAEQKMPHGLLMAFLKNWSKYIASSRK
jgi:hypothetical protein